MFCWGVCVENNMVEMKKNQPWPGKNISVYWTAWPNSFLPVSADTLTSKASERVRKTEITSKSALYIIMFMFYVCWYCEKERAQDIYINRQLKVQYEI